MRLRTILSLLESVDLEKLKPSASPLKEGVSFGGLGAFRKTVAALEPVEALALDLKILKSSPIFQSDAETLEVGNETTAQQISAASLSLFTGAKAILNALKQVMPEDESPVITVSVPEPVNIKKLIYVCGKLEKALQGSITGNELGGKSAIKHIDPAADWIEVDVGTEEALRLAGDLVWSAAVVYGRYQEAKIFEEHVKTLKIKTESMEDLKRGQSEAIVRLIHTESAHLVEKHLKGNGGQLEKFKAPIKLMADLIKDGVRIAPADDAQEDVKVLFPDYAKLGEIESRAGEASSEAREKEAEPEAQTVKPEAKAQEKQPRPAEEPKPADNSLAQKEVKMSDTVDLEV